MDTDLADRGIAAPDDDLMYARRNQFADVRDSKGVRRRFDVGRGLGLGEARRKAEGLRRAIREGVDPTNERRAARQRAQAARDGVGTLKALLDNYFDSGPGARQRRAAKTKRLLKTVFIKVLDSALLDLDRATLQLTVDGWCSQQTAAWAVRSLRPCLKWAEKRALVQAGIWNLEPPAAVAQRERVLSQDEVRAIWPHLDGRRGQVVKWLLLTGCRLNEAAGMTWQEVRNGKWTIPAVRAKSNRQRDVPLPLQAVTLLQALGPGEAGARVFPSAGGRVLSNWDRATKRLHELSGTSGWHRHDGS